LLANGKGVPVATSVFEGDTENSNILLEQVRRVRKTFAISSFAIVGDRGMITRKLISALRNEDGVDWITALRPNAIRKLLADDVPQMGLFDERKLVTLIHPDFPGERLVACRNPKLARRRAAKRDSLVKALAVALDGRLA